MTTINDREGTQTSKTDFKESTNNNLTHEKERLEKYRATPKSTLNLKPKGMDTKAIHENIENNRENRIKAIDNRNQKPEKVKKLNRQFSRSTRGR